MTLKGKVAIVTGSTSGIGLGIARAFAGEGADVLLNGFGDAGEIERLRRDISDACGVRTAYSGADMSKPDQVAGMVEQATAELGRVDILVNNAGIQHTAPVQDFPADRWDAVIAINLWPRFTPRRRPCRRCWSATGAGSSTSPARTASSPAPRNRPMWPRSTASSASPRWLRWRRPPPA